MKKLFSNKLYVATLISDTVSNLGDILFYLALMSYVLQVPETKLAISLIGISEMLPMLFGVLLGYFADRFPNKVNGILLSQVLRAILYSLLGLAMGWRPALWIALFAIGINLISDLAGAFENALFIPVSLRLVADEDRAQALGISSALTQLGRVVFNSAGAVLLTWFSYQTIAFLNAGTFMIAAGIIFSIKPLLNHLFTDRPLLSAEKINQASTFSLRQFKATFNLAIKEIFAIPVIKGVMIVAPLLNAVAAGIQTIFVLQLNNQPNFILVNPAVSLAAFTTILSLGSILGSLLVDKLFGRMNLKAIFILDIILTTLIYVFMLLGNSYGVLICLFSMGISMGAVNPKLNALIINTLSEDKIAMVTNAISTYFTAMMAIAQFILSSLILLFAAETLLWGLILLSLLLLGYTMTMKAVEV
ncbi:MFS transporter [Streptococcus pluranimalium]